MKPSLEDKKARLRGYVERRSASASIPDIGPHTPRRSLEPLSPAQEGLWMTWCLEGPNAAYNNTVVLLSDDRLDVEALNLAVRDIVRRHGALRTSFVEREGVPYQKVAAPARFHVEVERLVADEVDGALRAEARRPFAIDADRLFQIKLYETADGRSHLLVRLHHSISDAPSMGALAHELSVLYRAHSTGKDSNLPEPAITYVDYSHWHREWLASGALDGQLAYWREQLRDLPRQAAVPRCGVLSAGESTSGNTLEFGLDGELAQQLKVVGAAHQCSFYVTLVAALAVLLHRYSAQSDVAIGTGVSTRRAPGTEGVIGFFVNTLVLRLQIGAADDFQAVLERTRRVVATALNNQDVPYHRVVEELERSGDATGSALVEVVFTMQTLSPDRRVEPPFSIGELPPSGAAKFDVAVSVQEHVNGLSGQIEYRTKVFDESTIAALARHYVHLLEQIASNPSLKVGDYSLLDDEERRLLTREWSGREHRGTVGRSIHGLFAEQARQTPDATAVVSGSTSLAYGQLEARANQMARRLSAVGVGSTDLVAICLERGIEMVVSLLAVLKAGAAYVPIDPRAPIERLHAQLKDAGVGVLVTSDEVRNVVPLEVPITVTVDAGEGELEEDGARPDPRGTPMVDDEEAVAYVMFTSGSTGTPKGVAVRHQGVTRLVVQPDWITLDRQTVTLHHSVTAFDASTFEIWAPLLNGGCLVLAGADSADILGLAEEAARYGVNTLWLTAGVLPLWVNQPECRRVPLRYLLVGGDVVSEHHVRRLYECDPSVVVINGYGPTENTTFSCCYRVPRGPTGALSLPIGRPIKGSTAYVLDEGMHLQPVGCVGELYVGGAGLASGYWLRPDLTSLSFVPSPFSETGGERLYRTGDRVRWLPSGDLEFIGRLDKQVKVRGYRIELGEVESHLRHIQGVREVVVVAVEGRGSDAELVAYVVPASEALVAPNATAARRRWLRSCRREAGRLLPQYMVPSQFVCCRTLPLTENGKIDRKRLPEPQWQERLAEEYAKPSTSTEQSLCEIWQDALDVARVGVDEDFFDLGGHSLVAMRVVARVNSQLGVRLTLGELFRHPTVAELAAFLRDAGDAYPDEDSVTIAADEDHRHEPFPMTPVQQAYWLGRSGLFELGNVATHAYLEIELPTLDVPRLEHAWNRLIARHDMLRAVFSDDGTQRVLPSVNRYVIKHEDLTNSMAEDVDARLQGIRNEISHKVHPGTTWPLFEVRVTRVSSSAARVHFSMDALPVDAMSAMVLARELDMLYENPAADLPQLDIGFRDYVLASERLRSSARYQRARAYWEERISRLPPAPGLPLAKDPSEITEPRFRRRSRSFPAPLWTRLQRRTAEAGITPSGLLMSVYSRVLGLWCQTRHFTLNVTLFNRRPLHPQVDRLVGDFTSLVPLEVDDRTGQPLGSFAQDVQAHLWGGAEHRQFDGIEVMRMLNRRGGARRPSLLPVVFTSTLGLAGSRDEQTQAGPLARALAEVSERSGFGITQTSQVWLDNVVSETKGRLIVTWDALEELFSPGVLDGMFAAYCGMLNDLATGSASLWETYHSRLSAGQDDVRQEVNATATAVPDGLLQDPFLHQVEAQPAAHAVVQGDVTLSYRDLDHYARRLAQQLRASGVAPQDVVPVVMTKGWEQVVGVLAILYVGAVYLPIEADIPQRRLQMLLSESRATTLVTQSGLVARIPWPDGLHLVAVDQGDCCRPVTEPSPRSPATPDDRAYVIFTSGSTGVPKGVVISHRSALNTITDVNRRFDVGPADSVLGLASLAFDLSVYDIFGVLGAGGLLVLPEAGKEKDTRHWRALVERHGITIWNTVPVLAQLWAEELHAEVRPAQRSVRLVMMSGDWIPVRLPPLLRTELPDAVLVGLGGATEASIWSVAHVIEDVDSSWKSIPYGRPLSNQTCHVLREDLSECPDWVPGRLYIGGVGLAEGYWGDAEKTSEKFIDNPHTGERLYDTGDIGRCWPDGTIEFLGREDAQVKVHGHRIELGEIEAVLTRHEHVAAAAVAVTGADEGRRLVAYVVPEDGASRTDLPSSRPPTKELPSLAEFKLGQPGLRRFSEPVDTHRLMSSRVDQDGPPTLELVMQAAREAAHALDWSRPDGGAISAQDLGRWLSSVAHIPVSGHPIPRRCYPSAGSLYPVQTYVTIDDGVAEGVPAGSYYYDPSAHDLVRTGALFDRSITQSGFAVFLVEATDASVPVYGKRAHRLCLLEAGHMVALLAAAAQPCGLVIKETPWSHSAALCRALRLGEQHRFLTWCIGKAAPGWQGPTTTLVASARQSYRRFLGGSFDVRDLRSLLSSVPDEGLSIYVYVKPGAVHGDEGYFLFDRARQRLVRMDGDVSGRLVPEAHDADNRSVHDNSAFSLLIVGNPRDYRHSVAAGRLGQSLMMLAPTFNIGLCPIGGMTFGGLASRLSLPESRSLVYGFEGGPVTPDQALHWTRQPTIGQGRVVAELKEFVEASLPAYMVPTSFVTIPALPLTRNGKVDRAALPEVSVPGVSTPYRAPNTDVECSVERIWSEVLGVERVGMADDLFDLGGDSLHAMRIVSGVRDAFPEAALTVTLEALFKAPRVDAMAALVELGRDARMLEDVGPIQGAVSNVEEGTV